MNSFVKYIMKPLTLIGALNCGLVGLFNFDLIVEICGGGTMLTRIIYSVVGIAAAVWIALMMSSKK